MLVHVCNKQLYPEKWFFLYVSFGHMNRFDNPENQRVTTQNHRFLQKNNMFGCLVVRLLIQVHIWTC